MTFFNQNHQSYKSIDYHEGIIGKPFKLILIVILKLGIYILRIIIFSDILQHNTFKFLHKLYLFIMLIFRIFMGVWQAGLIIWQKLEPSWEARMRWANFVWTEYILKATSFLFSFFCNCFFFWTKFTSESIILLIIFDNG